MPNATPAPKIPSILRREIISTAVFLLMLKLPSCANTSKALGWRMLVPKEGDVVLKDNRAAPMRPVFVGFGGRGQWSFHSKYADKRNFLALRAFAITKAAPFRITK
jgi:hypothetical protein